MKVALTMIVSGSEDPGIVKRCLNSVAPYVHGAYVTVTSKDENNLVDTIKEHGVVVDYHPNKFFKTVTKEDVRWFKDWTGYKPQMKVGDRLFQFDRARNHNLSQVPDEYDWFIWLDADDILRGGDKLQATIEEAEKSNAAAVFMNYLYQVEMEGDKIKNIIIEHLRERVLKNNSVYRWVAPIHETLIEQKPTDKIKTDQIDVVHLSNTERMMGAMRRNAKTLELHLTSQKGEDPRTCYYLGKVYYDMANHVNDQYWTQAEFLFDKYLNGSEEYDFNNKSGWAEERAQCWEYMIEIARKRGDHELSLEYGMKSLLEDEKFPSTYLNIGLSHLILGNFERAIFWVKLSAAVPQPETTLVNNPKDIQGRALEVLYNANIQLNKLDQAWAASKKLYEMFPDNPDMIERYKFTTSLREERELTKAAMKLANYIGKFDDQSKLKPLLLSLPAKIANNPFMTDLANKIMPPKKWGKKEMAILCGPGFTPWSPKKLENPGGSFLGGSEEAVIYLSKELAKLGWKVTVYGDPMEDEGEYDGVVYLPYYKFNPKDEFNVLVLWRQPNLLDNNYNAKKVYVWCHDIQNPLDYTPERLEKVEKIIVLSPWHRQNLPKVPDEKILISGNGI